MMIEQQRGLRERNGTASLGVALLAGVVLGSAATYLLDPRQGSRRRAVARDKFSHLIRRALKVTVRSARHLRNQAEGLLANANHSLRSEGSVSDRRLLDRIRSTAGRSVPHPHAVDFAVHDGMVTVRGYLKPHEAGELLRSIEQVSGVRGIKNEIVDSGAAPQHMQ